MNAPATRRRLKLAVLALNFGFVALTAGQARAGCLDGLLHLKPQPASAPRPAAQPSPAAFMSAVYRPDDASPAFLHVDDRHDDQGNDRRDDASIVGLWEFTLDGPQPDFGTQAWHSDGTELMFSAGRDPATADVCQGVWRRIGPNTYSLNHIAMGWDFGYGSALVRVHIHAVVRVDRSGGTYSGGYKARVYLVSPANPFEEDDSTFQVEASGKISGTRVQPD